RRLQPDDPAQQAAGFLPGMARAGGAARRAPAGDGADPDAAIDRRLRLADAAQLGSRRGQEPAGVAARDLSLAGPRRVEPGPVRGPPARRVLRLPRSALAAALPRRHAARFQAGGGAGQEDGTREEIALRWKRTPAGTFRFESRQGETRHAPIV